MQVLFRPLLRPVLYNCVLLFDSRVGCGSLLVLLYQRAKAVSSLQPLLRLAAEIKCARLPTQDKRGMHYFAALKIVLRFPSLCFFAAFFVFFARNALRPVVCGLPVKNISLA